MSGLHKSLLIFVGAGVGANLRYWLSVLIADKVGEGFPWSTWTVNLTGSFLLGIFFGVSSKLELSPAYGYLLAVGALGGYTTFSTFAMESAQLASSGKTLLFWLYAGSSIVACIAAAWLGQRLAS